MDRLEVLERQVQEIHANMELIVNALGLKQPLGPITKAGSKNYEAMFKKEGLKKIVGGKQKKHVV